MKLDLTTITWLVELTGKQREDCLEEGKRFKKIASGEYGSPEEYGYKNRGNIKELNKINVTFLTRFCLRRTFSDLFFSHLTGSGVKKNSDSDHTSRYEKNYTEFFLIPQV